MTTTSLLLRELVAKNENQLEVWEDERSFVIILTIQGTQEDVHVILKSLRGEERREKYEPVHERKCIEIVPIRKISVKWNCGEVSQWIQDIIIG